MAVQICKPLDEFTHATCNGCGEKPATVWARDENLYCDECKPNAGDLFQCPDCGGWFWDGNFMENSDGETVCIYCY